MSRRGNLGEERLLKDLGLQELLKSLGLSGFQLLIQILVRGRAVTFLRSYFHQILWGGILMFSQTNQEILLTTLTPANLGLPLGLPPDGHAYQGISTYRMYV